MIDDALTHPDEIRARFSHALSHMYRAEVPQYGNLISLVSDINAKVLAEQPELRRSLETVGELDRLSEERHGAIRVGTAAELAMIARAFAIMNMIPVGYYDLASAGVPVHSTAFRPVDTASLQRNCFRVFTSLLRLELIEDPALRQEAAETLALRQIFTPQAIELIQLAERNGGLTSDEADAFVSAVLDTFRWHSEATVSASTYRHLVQAHRLVADVVSFRGPHINHLTPRTLDIDMAQAAMPAFGMSPKEEIEGPPSRRCPILLRQTSFKALEESIAFVSGDDRTEGVHTARFGEIEQRGAALTPAGRELYDTLLTASRQNTDRFGDFPDDWTSLRREGLAWFRYRLVPDRSPVALDDAMSLEALIELGQVEAHPIVYEDFLPVSAAGIFRSNLGSEVREAFTAQSDKQAFEQALGRSVLDEMALYEVEQTRSIEAVRRGLAVLADVTENA
jgi:uncharacterized glyoxalase superfamily metalloenzyme YdcJ